MLARATLRAHTVRAAGARKIGISGECLNPGTVRVVTSFRTPTLYLNVGEYANHDKVGMADGHDCHHL